MMYIYDFIMLKRSFCFFLVYFVPSSISMPDMESCYSEVYCQGKLLHTIQKAKPFTDSKYFVDMMMRYKETKVLENFDIFMEKTNNHPSLAEVRDFVRQNFVRENELEAWDEENFRSNPRILKDITVPRYKNFAKKLMPIWKVLGRRIKRHVIHKYNISRYSIIPVPYGFVVPGGRFREFYYWDSYWIIIGLLNSDMTRTTKGMLENFFYLVNRFGFIPNGGRIYYLNRSQPPLLLMMFHEYYKRTKNTEWLRNKLPLLEKELMYWLRYKTLTFSVGNSKYTLARYYVNSSSPRPESYSEDYETCEKNFERTNVERCYRELKAGAESGWDFSSRWMTDRQSLSDMKTSRIIPVDLNAVLAKSFQIISQYYSSLHDNEKHQYWFKMFKKWRRSIHTLLYNKNDGIWYDFDTVLMKQNRKFFCSNFAPLWVDMYTNPEVKDVLGKRAVDYLESYKIMSYLGGIPTSLIHTGQQWDFPNSWPPLQSMVILGLHRSGNEKAQKLARILAQRWLDVNQRIFNDTKIMYEKYNSEAIGQAGGGGEYEVQGGFGWTNGVILELIDEFFTRNKNVEAAEEVKSIANKVELRNACLIVVMIISYIQPIFL